MTDSVHPTIEELADLHADVLPDADAIPLRAHVDSCDECRADLARLDEVSELLAGAGGDEPMPAEVITQVDTALATAGEQRDDRREVSSMALARARRDRIARRTRGVLIAGAAAAAFVVIGAIGIDAIRGGGSNDSDSAGSGADVAELQRDEAPSDSGAGKAESGSASQEMRPGDVELTTESLPRYARKLAAGGEQENRSQISRTCTAAVPEGQKGLVRSQVVWQGAPAVVVVDPGATTATVFGCGTDGQELYSTSY